MMHDRLADRTFAGGSFQKAPQPEGCGGADPHIRRLAQGFRGGGAFATQSEAVDKEFADVDDEPGEQSAQDHASPVDCHAYLRRGNAPLLRYELYTTDTKKAS